MSICQMPLLGYKPGTLNRCRESFLDQFSWLFLAPKKSIDYSTRSISSFHFFCGDAFIVRNREGDTYAILNDKAEMREGWNVEGAVKIGRG